MASFCCKFWLPNKIGPNLTGLNQKTYQDMKQAYFYSFLTLEETNISDEKVSKEGTISLWWPVTNREFNLQIPPNQLLY